MMSFDEPLTTPLGSWSVTEPLNILSPFVLRYLESKVDVVFAESTNHVVPL